MDPSPRRRTRTFPLQLGLVAAVIAFWVTGCRHYNAINFATSTQFGVKVGVNADKIPEVQVGYNRQEAARVPVYLEQDEDLANAAKTSGSPSVHTVLRRAQGLLQSADTNDQATGVKLVQSLADKTANSLGTNLVYQLAFAEAAKGLGTGSDDKRPKTDPALLNSCIQAALDLAMEPQRFHEQGKFIGTRKKDELADAYSVLGTFSGDGAGSANTNSARVKIAQFFATGIAAQELARAGGAATVNPGAKSPDALSAEERMKERRIGRQQAEDTTALDEVAKVIFGEEKDSLEDRSKRAAKALADIAFPQVNGAPAKLDEEATRFSKLKSVSAIRDRLRLYEGQGKQMLENLNKTNN